MRELQDEFNFRVIGFPASDPGNDIPYILSKSKNKKYLKKLPQISSEATIITSKLSENSLKKIFSIIDENSLVNIIGVDKEIADLITADDLSSIDLVDAKDKVIIPGMTLIRDEQAEKIFNYDGKKKRVVRGPVMLTPLDATILNEETPIEFELKAFTNLINLINT